jgi:hypothetical protein
MMRVWVVVSIVLCACSGPSKPGSGGGGPIGAGGNDTAPVASPGLLVVPTSSASFTQGLELADKDAHGAMAAFDRVRRLEHENKPVAAVATYNIATLALERGWYDLAAALYGEVIQHEIPELQVEAVSGLVAIFDRLEDPDLGADQMGAIPAEVFGRLPADRAVHAKYLQSLYRYRAGQLEESLATARAIPADWKYAALAANLIARLQLRMNPPEAGDLDDDQLEKLRIPLRAKLLRLEGEPWKRAAMGRDRAMHQKTQLDAVAPELGTTGLADDFALELTYVLANTEKVCTDLTTRIKLEQEEAIKHPDLVDFAVSQPCAPPAAWPAPKPVTRIAPRTITLAAIAAKPVAAPPPDKDRDGVADADDKCPDIAGAQNGCPGDRDRDGTADNEDKCPSVAGDKANKGCPVEKDSDGDGMLDAKDDCKTDAGVPALNGCPDGDSDGVADRYDACPSIRGTVKAGPYIGCAPRPNPKCSAPKSKASKPTGYQCGYGKPKVGVGCTCPGGQTSVLVDEDIAVCWAPPPGC